MTTCLGAISRQSPEKTRRNPAPLVLGAAAALLIGILTLIALGNGDDNREAPRAERTPAATKPASGPSPAAAVNAFYQAAATGDYATAWAKATPNAHQQLGGYDSFARGQSTLESISFPKLKITSQTGDGATVELHSEAVHADRVDRCKGTVDLVRTGGEWKLDRLNIAGCAQKRRK